jgi:hypothetical protein
MAKFPERDTSLLTKLGLLALKWNNLEASAQLMVCGLAGGAGKIDILTGHMNGSALLDALQTLGAEFAPENLKPHIEYFVRLFERNRECRDYYIHGIRGIVQKEDGIPAGVAEFKTAKGRLVISEGKIGEEDIQSCIDNVRAAQEYGTHIVTVIWGTEADESLREHFGNSFLRKPLLPDKPPKTRMNTLYDMRRSRS